MSNEKEARSTNVSNIYVIKVKHLYVLDDSCDIQVNWVFYTSLALVTFGVNIDIN